MTADVNQGLYRYKALLLPWSVRGLDSLVSAVMGLRGSAWWDGDTFNALVSRGEHDYLLTHVRCGGYDAPELSSGEPGTAAKGYARSLVDAGGIVYLDSDGYVARDEVDDFGRMLAKVTLSDGRDLASLMIASGHAVVDNS